MDPHQLLKSFKTAKILVIGDLMLDEYVRGDILRISPEAPVPVILEKSHECTLGGAANVAANIHSLGGSVHMIGVIGDDEAGRIFLGIAKIRGLIVNNSNQSIFVDKIRPTTRKLRIYAGGVQIVRVDFESSIPIPAELEGKILASFEAGISNVDCVIISDYNKGVVTKSLAKKCIDIASNAKVPILIDSKNYVTYAMKGATVLKPNLKELSKETGLPCGSDAQIEKAGFALFAKLSPKALLVTAGEKGMFLFVGKKITRIPGIKTKVADVSGAGDSVISAMALAIACNASFHEAAIIANYAAAAAVAKEGTVAPTIAEIESLISAKARPKLVRG
ncbi:MAG: PfkB family carbohydrate kinase [Candidatus Micrarchaeota archaeon]